MRHYNRLLLGAFAVGALAACTDESMLPYEGGAMPENLAQLVYLNNYDALKNYVNRANPDFKLGLALGANDFTKGELVHSLAVSNFDEMTAGNEMKYSSVVGTDGSMDFTTVTDFVQAAKEAGMTVYGHTLCWHSQQTLAYLNGLIAPTVIPGEDSNGGLCLLLKNSSAKANIYDAQTWYQLAAPLTQGTTYTLKFVARASEAYHPEIYLQSSLGGAQQYPGGIDISEMWEEKTFTFTPSDGLVDKIAFNFGTAAVNIWIDNISLTADGSTENLIANSDFEDGTITGWTGWSPGAFESISGQDEGYAVGGGAYDESVITNSDFETGISGWGGWGGSATRNQSAQGGGYNSDYSFEIVNPAAAANPWDIQVAWDFAAPLVPGGTYRLSMMVKGSVDGSIGAGFQRKSDYAGAGDFPAIPVTTEWTEYSAEISVSGGGADNADRFLFNIGTYAGTINIDDITICYFNPNAGGQTIEMPAEEKKAVLTNALETWIAGMMNACKENPSAGEGEDAGATLVKAWDAVNEPMSDGNTSQLKSAATESAESASQSFYWQDYLGKDYARQVVKFARQYGGDDLKLFINDYNLEAAYNNNAKCQGLIDMVKYWESDGVTKIDGIGTQMHVSYSMNPATQQKNEECVERMFQLLAASGKLIKISELDMGIQDENGTAILTEDVTLEQQKLMAGYYTFIIQKYFELIPAAQQYGITQWSATDSPAGSGWRAGEPIGLWDANYNRKPTYAGFANGLAGEVIDAESTAGSTQTAE